MVDLDKETKLWEMKLKAQALVQPYEAEIKKGGPEALRRYESIRTMFIGGTNVEYLNLFTGFWAQLAPPQERDAYYASEKRLLEKMENPRPSQLSDLLRKK